MNVDKWINGNIEKSQVKKVLWWKRNSERQEKEKKKDNEKIKMWKTMKKKTRWKTRERKEESQWRKSQSKRQEKEKLKGNEEIIKMKDKYKQEEIEEKEGDLKEMRIIKRIIKKKHKRKNWHSQRKRKIQT